VTGTWADTVVLGTPSTSETSLSDANGIVTITDASGSTGIQQGSSNYKITYDGTAYVPMKLSGSRNFTLSYKEGVTINEVTLMAMSNGDAGGTVGAGDGDATSLGTFPARNKTGNCLTVDITGKPGLRGSRQFLVLIVVDYSISGPVLSVIPNKLSFSLNPKKATDTQNFTLRGENLTDGTYNLDIPSVAGLSVSPTSFTVADGAVNQEFAVTYASSEDVEKNTVNITTPEINGKSVTVAVTYKSRATLFTQTITSEAATWDWSKVSGADRSYTEAEPEVYSNFDEYTFGDGFNAHAWMIYSSPNMYSGGALRLGKIGLQTSVPGTLTVDFSDTGNKSGTGEGTKRYLAVNDVPTQYYTNRQEGTDDNKSHKQTGVVVNVPAGVVTISSSNSYIALYKVVFTPEASPASSVSATLSASGLSSFCSAYALDFSGVTGLKAYVVTAVTSTSVTLTQVDKVPGGTGVILQGTVGETYTIPVAATIPDAPATNKMVGTLNDTNVSAEYAYALKDGKFHPVNAGTIAAGKAYLPASAVPASAPELAIVFDGQTTGIQGVEAQKQVENGVFYNLAGQRVAQPTKGLYIVNGKKVVMK
jgi:hypothetical protein